MERDKHSDRDRQKKVSLQISADAHAAVRRVSTAFGMKQAHMIAAMARGWEMLEPDEQARAIRPSADVVLNASQAQQIMQMLQKVAPQGAHV